MASGTYWTLCRWFPIPATSKRWREEPWEEGGGEGSGWGEEEGGGGGSGRSANNVRDEESSSCEDGNGNEAEKKMGSTNAES